MTHLEKIKASLARDRAAFKNTQQTERVKRVRAIATYSANGGRVLVAATRGRKEYRRPVSTGDIIAFARKTPAEPSRVVYRPDFDGVDAATVHDGRAPLFGTFPLAEGR